MSLPYHKTRFAIVTPTIGRPVLHRCLESLAAQTFKDVRQIVVGDGPQDPWVRKYVESKPQTHYFETTANTRNFGCAQRNLALQKIEEVFPADYVLFVDDDNVLLESALFAANQCAIDHKEPPLMYQEIVFTNKWHSHRYWIFPDFMPPQQAHWDGLNGIFRADVVSGLRWQEGYAHDFFYAKEAMERAGTDQFAKVNGIGGIHHLSFDTYSML